MASPKQDGPAFSLSVVKSGTMVNHRARVSPHLLEVSFAKMNGWEKRPIKFRAGDKVRLGFQCQLASGSLVVELVAPDGSTAIRWGDSPGATNDFVAEVDGKYIIRATAEHASGGYKIEIAPD